jgi:hypothetical protein
MTYLINLVAHYAIGLLRIGVVLDLNVLVSEGVG